MAWRKNDPSLGNDPSYLEPRITSLENEMPKKLNATEKGVPNGLATYNADGKVVDANGNEVEGKVKSVNGVEPNVDGNITISIPNKTSDIENDSGFITVSSVTKAQVGLSSVQNYGVATQAEAEAGTASNKYMTPQRTAQAIAKLAPIPTASQIPIADTSNLFSALTVEDALSELFTNVSSGKNQIATAITDKGVSASGSDPFATLASKIGEISGGKRWASGQQVSTGYVTVNGLGFSPNYVIVKGSLTSNKVRDFSIYANMNQLGTNSNLEAKYSSDNAAPTLATFTKTSDGFSLQVASTSSTNYTWIAFE